MPVTPPELPRHQLQRMNLVREPLSPQRDLRETPSQQQRRCDSSSFSSWIPASATRRSITVNHNLRPLQIRQIAFSLAESQNFSTYLLPHTCSADSRDPRVTTQWHSADQQVKSFCFGSTVVFFLQNSLFTVSLYK